MSMYCPHGYTLGPLLNLITLVKGRSFRNLALISNVLKSRDNNKALTKNGIGVAVIQNFG